MHKSAFLHFHFHYPNRSWSWMVLWRPTGPSRTNTKKTNQLTKNMIGKKKSCPFHHRELECKNRKLRDTWDDRQVWPWSTNEARQRLIAFCQKNALVIANNLFQQHKRRLYTWTSPENQYWNQIDYTLCSWR